MIWLIWVTQAILWALRLVVSKVVFEKKIFWPDFQTLFSRVIHINILLLFFLFWLSNYDMSYKSISLWEWGLFILSSLFLYANYYLKINAYSNEKISTLQPFAMLVQVFPIIFWFIFLASERASLTTFIMALLASFIVIWASIDHKKLKINKYSLMVLFWSLIQSIQIFFIVYLLTKIGPTDLYFTESIILIIISVLFIFLKKEFGKIKFLTKKYFFSSMSFKYHKYRLYNTHANPIFQNRSCCHKFN